MSMRREAFTLFEVILAIALSAALFVLIGTAINLYLMRVDASRTRVEEAQLARSILAMIADDLRSASVYEPQDTSSVAVMMASSVVAAQSESEDENSAGAASGSGGASAPGSSSNSASTGSSGGGTSASGGGGSGSGGSMSVGSSLTSEPDNTLPLGLNGTLNEVYVDATRLPRRGELFSATTGYTHAPSAATTGVAGAAPNAIVGLPASDLKTVRYFVREGIRNTPQSPSPNAYQMWGGEGGLIRQEIPRRMRMFAEQSGNSAVLEAGQELIAPEVVQLQFRYYDGQQVTDVWDMRERKSLPAAIEVRIWLVSNDAQETANGALDSATLVGAAREYRQTVRLAMATRLGVGSSMSSGSSNSSNASADSSSSNSASSFSE